LEVPPVELLVSLGAPPEPLAPPPVVDPDVEFTPPEVLLESLSLTPVMVPDVLVAAELPASLVVVLVTCESVASDLKKSSAPAPEQARGKRVASSHKGREFMRLTMMRGGMGAMCKPVRKKRRKPGANFRCSRMRVFTASCAKPVYGIGPAWVHVQTPRTSPKVRERPRAAQRVTTNPPDEPVMTEGSRE
jgi:hypothetical protein